jgi:hypothetical protein
MSEITAGPWFDEEQFIMPSEHLRKCPKCGLRMYECACARPTLVPIAPGFNPLGEEQRTPIVQTSALHSVEEEAERMIPLPEEQPSAHARDLSKLLVSIRTMPDTCLWGLAADRKTLYRRYTPQGVGSVGFKWYAEPGPRHDSPIRQIEPGPDGYIRALMYDGAIFTREPEVGTARWEWKRTSLVLGTLPTAGPVSAPTPGKLEGSP